ncbi:MAG: tRNA-dihydrouridine synthase family protein [Parcubacteria group bacterium]|nr:tRNA-dihydrouridine synthase family protein [Parcubacteria group bacterium]
MENFWETLSKPLFVLAPMEDITDAAFRELLGAQEQKPVVFYTEFTSADGLALAPKEGREKLLKKLQYTEGERPIVAQFFTAHPAHMEKAAALAQELGFDGVDINMGCPDRAVEKGGCGAALIKNPALARDLIRAARAGAPQLPISLKTRIGYLTDELDTWLPTLLAEEPAAIAIHARTRKELSEVPAHWDAITRAVQMRNGAGVKTLIIGNGDVKTLGEARERVRETGCDGVMIGRAAIANPWLWREREPARDERLATLLHHATLAEKHEGHLVGGVRKHLSKYATGLHAAKELRVKISSAETVKDIVDSIEALH